MISQASSSPESFPAPPSRDQLASVPWERVHRARSWSQATIWGLVWEGHRLIVKDASRQAWPVRITVGGWSIRREARAYQRLQGIQGIPKVHGLIRGPALVMEWLPTKRLPHRAEGGLTPEFFDDLDRLLAEIHQAGVAHGDIRRKNIVVGDDGRPHLIDFTTSVICNSRSLWPRRYLFRHLAKVDCITAVRIRQTFFPDLPLTHAQQTMLDRPPLLLRLGRFYRKRLYRPFKKKILRR